MIELFAEKKNCCGCGACSSICPKNAITMQEDEYGFIYPEIDSKKCVECGLCISSCHYKSADDLHTPIKVWQRSIEMIHCLKTLHPGVCSLQ